MSEGWEKGQDIVFTNTELQNARVKQDVRDHGVRNNIFDPDLSTGNRTYPTSS